MTYHRGTSRLRDCACTTRFAGTPPPVARRQPPDPLRGYPAASRQPPVSASRQPPATASRQPPVASLSTTAAFTILELLTVIAIIALIGGLSAGAYQVAYRNYSLQATAGRIQGILRAARNASLTTGNSSHVVIDPGARTVTAQAYERVAEWGFDGEGEEGQDEGGFGGSTAVVHAARSVAGRVGKALQFSVPGTFVDCGAQARFDLRTGVLIEAWVRHHNVYMVKQGAEDDAGTAARGSRTSRATFTRRGASASRDRTAPARNPQEVASVILAKEGAYFLGMTRSGALEGAIGDHRVRSEDGVVQPDRWVRVEMRFDGKTIDLSADGVPRESLPLGPQPITAVAGDRGPAGKPAAAPVVVPVTLAPVTISSPVRPFPGEIDEVRLGGSSEPVSYAYAPHEHILGWKKVIHFDRRGHLDPSRHSSGYRIVLIELPDDLAAPKVGTTAVVVDYSVTFEEWSARFDNPESMRQDAEEAKLEAFYGKARMAVIELDRLGVIR